MVSEFRMQFALSQTVTIWSLDREPAPTTPSLQVMTRAWDTRWAMYVKTMLCIPSSRFQRQDGIAGQFWSPFFFCHFYPFALLWNCVLGDLFRREPIHRKQRTWTEHIFEISLPLSLPWMWNIVEPRQWLWECRTLAAEYADSVLLKSHVSHLGFSVSHLLMSIRSICKMRKSKACSLDDWPARPWGLSHGSCVNNWMGNPSQSLLQTEAVANSKVGGHKFRGISGGERRRTAVGVPWRQCKKK